MHVYSVAARKSDGFTESAFSAPDLAYAGTTPPIVTGAPVVASDIVGLRTLTASLHRLTPPPQSGTFTDASVADCR